MTGPEHYAAAGNLLKGVDTVRDYAGRNPQETLAAAEHRRVMVESAKVHVLMAQLALSVVHQTIDEGNSASAWLEAIQ